MLHFMMPHVFVCQYLLLSVVPNLLCPPSIILTVLRFSDHFLACLFSRLVNVHFLLLVNILYVQKCTAAVIHMSNLGHPFFLCFWSEKVC